jgi:hypothetical protein
MLTEAQRFTNREDALRKDRSLYAAVLAAVQGSPHPIRLSAIVNDPDFRARHGREANLLTAHPELGQELADAMPEQVAARLVIADAPRAPNAQLKLAPGLVDRLPENLKREVRSLDGAQLVPATLADDLAKAGFLVQGDAVLERPADGPRVADPAKYEISAADAKNFAVYSELSAKAREAGQVVKVVR